MTGTRRFALDGRVAVVTGGGGGLGSAGALAHGRMRRRHRARRAQPWQAGSRGGGCRKDGPPRTDRRGRRHRSCCDDGGRKQRSEPRSAASTSCSTTPASPIRNRCSTSRRRTFCACSRSISRAPFTRSGLSRRRCSRRAMAGSSTWARSCRGAVWRTGGAYCASKAGLANLGAACAFEFGGQGITVNTLGATVIVTDLNRELVRTQPATLRARSSHRTPLGRLGEVEDLMGALLFLRIARVGFHHRPDAVRRRRLHRRLNRRKDHDNDTSLKTLFRFDRPHRVGHRRLARARPRDGGSPRRGSARAIILTARKQTELDEAVAHLRALGIEASAIAADVGNPDGSRAQVVETVKAAGGRIDILVNNAGTSWGAKTEEMPLDGWNKLMAVNLTGPVPDGPGDRARVHDPRGLGEASSTSPQSRGCSAIIRRMIGTYCL